MRASQPATVDYLHGSQISHRQQISPRKVLVPQEVILGKRRDHVDCSEAAIMEAIDGFSKDDHVTIAAGALRSVFGDLTAAAMGVPEMAADHHAVVVAVGRVRDTFNSTDRRRSNASHRS